MPATNCRDCGVLLTTENRRVLGNDLTNRCKDCYREKQKDWVNKRGKEKVLKQSTLLRHGLTIEQYEEMMRLQGGVCAICHQSNNIESRDLAVDHNHSTGQIRGLLCQNCNAAIGHVREDITILYSIIEYLNRHEPKVQMPNLVAFGKKETA